MGNSMPNAVVNSFSNSLNNPGGNIQSYAGSRRLNKYTKTSVTRSGDRSGANSEGRAILNSNIIALDAQDRN